jgi:hypothetical protein
VQELRRLKGIALIDVVKEIHPYIDKIDFPTETKIQLLDMLAEIECVHTPPPTPQYYAHSLYLSSPPSPVTRYRLSQGATEKMQLGALVGVFQVWFNSSSRPLTKLILSHTTPRSLHAPNKQEAREQTAGGMEVGA